MGCRGPGRGDFSARGGSSVSTGSVLRQKVVLAPQEAVGVVLSAVELVVEAGQVAGSGGWGDWSKSHSAGRGHSSRS